MEGGVNGIYGGGGDLMVCLGCVESWVWKVNIKFVENVLLQNTERLPQNKTKQKRHIAKELKYIFLQANF